MPENLPIHSHCLECDSAIPVGKPFCSDECGRKHASKAKRDRNRNLLFVAAAVAAVILIAILGGML
jgi:predicted nucleic acid-binding Zn ribbon protein